MKIDWNPSSKKYDIEMTAEELGNTIFAVGFAGRNIEDSELIRLYSEFQTALDMSR